MNEIKEFFTESAKIKQEFIAKNIGNLEEVIDLIVSCISKGNKIIIAGNGGSAADAQHRAAEFIGRYKLERRSIPAIALTTDTSIITAIGNDYGYDKIFERQLEGLGNKGDIFIGISTSGNSQNIIRAINYSNNNGINTISLLGRGGGEIKNISDHNLIVNSDNTPRIQECHQTIYHTICEVAENNLFN